MIKFFTSIVVLFSASAGFGQGIPLSVKEIDSVVSMIDTLTQLRHAVVDGTVHPKGKRKPKGSFSDIFLLLPSKNKLVKVQHGQSLYYLDHTTYYFYYDSLIFVRTSRYPLSGDTAHKISSGQYYFVNGEMVDRKEEGKLAGKPDVFLIHARQYLADVKNVFSLK